MSKELLSTALEAQTYEETVNHFGAQRDTGLTPSSLYEIYVGLKPNLLERCNQQLSTPDDLQYLYDILRQFRESGMFHENYFHNFLLSFHIYRSVENQTVKQEQLKVIDENVKPHFHPSELEVLFSAFLFVRLKQHGASYRKCAEVLARLGKDRKVLPAANSAIERKAIRIEAFLQNCPSIPLFMHMLDCCAILHLYNKQFSLQQYVAKHYKKKRAIALTALEKNFINPLLAYCATLDNAIQPNENQPLNEKMQYFDDSMKNIAEQLFKSVSKVWKGAV